MLKDPRDGGYKVIEFGTFPQVDLRHELIVDGVEGRYQHRVDKWEFVPGQHWIQDFGMRNVLMDYLRQHSDMA
jgi:hypothetical protein